ncbi:uncharacterized protein LOC124533127 [Vanessa cardui]|uniref:uncharacterized protein LOC124533127 n=1 Tax=Vanessa cardui TaxID=171605 RepID=UPI001F13A684|nr:uncharacterized protein LOC124533127 [Vanessa cardui]
MLRAIVFCVLLALVKGQTTFVDKCILNDGDLPIHQYLEGCDEPPCLLPQLQDAVINVVFRAPRTFRTLRTHATVFVTFLGGYSFEYVLGADADTCNFLTNTYCPVLKDEVIQYTLNLYIEPIFFVGASAVIEFRVVGDGHEPVWCIRVPIRVVPAINNPAKQIEQDTTRLTA